MTGFNIIEGEESIFSMLNLFHGFILSSGFKSIRSINQKIALCRYSNDMMNP